jgi:hypothetical protein
MHSPLRGEAYLHAHMSLSSLQLAANHMQAVVEHDSSLQTPARQEACTALELNGENSQDNHA